MRKLFLHMGTHKTGTTSIQDFCNQNTEILLDNNICYPKYSPSDERTKAHHDFFKALVSTTNRLWGQTEEIAEYWLTEANKKDCNLLVSAEPIYRLVSSQGRNYKEKQVDFLLKIKHKLRSFDVVPVIVFRDYKDFIRSLYAEQVNNGGVLGNYDLLEYSHSKIRPLIFYSQFIENVKNVFGSKEVVLKFEELSKDGQFLRSFFSELGVAIDKPEYEKTSRASLDIPLIRVKEVLNQRYRKDLKAKNKELNKKVLQKSEEIKSTIFDELGWCNNKESSLWSSTKALDEFENEIKDERKAFSKAVGFYVWPELERKAERGFIPPLREFMPSNIIEDLIRKIMSN